ncbi:hypothetical protein CVV38_02945 [Candidatus Peregrinibacteria bacterium HGW-Peregrinibacteria-1]|jgi:DNA-binding response OmpR family regulator|nr:MAG: hypothetical protein CVV38_02945 [Candidatus Peregrinibacteria bacterium HGW-Peregrinibacteria-1]
MYLQKVLTVPSSSVQLDCNLKTISSAGGKGVRLRRKEYDLLMYLIENKGRIVTRSQLLNNVWGLNDLVKTNTVDVYIGSLRKKLRMLTMKCPIETIHCFGYMLID